MGFLRKLFGVNESASEEEWEIQLQEPFHPQNELERQLEAYVAGRIDSSALVSVLVESQVFVLMHGPAQVPPPEPMRPLVLPSSKGVPSLSVFTSAPRSLEVQKKMPAYELGLLVDFRWVLKGAPRGIGLALNPSWKVSIELPPESLDQLREAYGQ